MTRSPAWPNGVWPEIVRRALIASVSSSCSRSTFGDGARDLRRDLERVRELRALAVAGPARRTPASLVLQTPERLAVNDAVAIALNAGRTSSSGAGRRRPRESLLPAAPGCRASRASSCSRRLVIRLNAEAAENAEDHTPEDPHSAGSAGSAFLFRDLLQEARVPGRCGRRRRAPPASGRDPRRSFPGAQVHAGADAGAGHEQRTHLRA